MAHSVGESAERHVRSGGMSMGLQIAFALCQPGWTSLFCGVTGALGYYSRDTMCYFCCAFGWLQYNTVQSGQILACRIVVQCGVHGAVE